MIDEMNGGEKKGMLHVKANNKLSKRLAVCIGESRTGQVNPTNRGNDHNENKQRNVVVETKYTKKKNTAVKQNTNGVGKRLRSSSPSYIKLLDRERMKKKNESEAQHTYSIHIHLHLHFIPLL